MITPYSEADLVGRIMNGKRANELRRLGGRGLDADRIILTELRYIAVDVAMRGDTAAEQHDNRKIAIRITNSRTFGIVSARIRGVIRQEQQQSARQRGEVNA